MVLLTLLGSVCACDAPRGPETVQAKTEEKEAEPVLSAQQVIELTEQCGRKAHEEFRRAWKEGTVETGDGKKTADFTHHYNARLNTCFYLLTVNHHTNDDGSASAGSNTVSKMLFDINEGEQYGEYLGPTDALSPRDGFPKTCKVVSFYCASRREWEVLVEPYMED
jgi:hypothetical protein